MHNKLISVIMSIYNENIDWIDNSVSSILNQTYENIEFIVILDNPDRLDVKEFISNISDSRLIFKINEKNMGLIYSLNKAVALSKGDYIARMDADDVSYLTRLEEQLIYIEKEDLDLIGCFINIVDSDLNYISVLRKVVSHKYICKLLRRGVISIVHPTFFGKSQVFKSCKYHEQALYAEDMEMICNAVAKGYKIGNLNKVLFDCRYNSASVTKKNSDAMDVTVTSIVKCFNNYCSDGTYTFLRFSDADERNSSDIKNHLLDIRNYYSNRKYIKMFFSFMKAICSNPISFKKTVFNSFYKSIYIYLEKMNSRFL